MKYQNQRPDLADQIKTLVQSANSTKTVPHGIKTVNPGEGLQLLSSDGQEIFWDWETAAEYDTRISEGREAIEQARVDLDKAEADLAAGAARLDENERILGALGPRVDAAESTVAQASKDLDALETSFGDVRAKADAADQRATDALTKAGAAQTSADGKNRITRAITPASQAGTAVGDTHFTMSSMGGGGTVTRQQRWDGSAWQDEALSHQVLASLDLGKATVGELDGIRIKANTVTADRLLVGIGDNYVPDPFFQAPAAWTVPLWVDPTADGYRSKGSLVIPAGTTQRGAYMVNRGNLPASRRVRFSVWVSSPTSLQAGHIRIFMRVYKADGTWVFGVPTFVDNTQFIAANTWGRVTGEFQAPEDGATFMVGLFAQAAATNTVRFSEMQVVGLTEGALIVQGSITGSQIDGESVTAKVVQSMTAEHKKLVVTESAILQHTTLLGTTVADQLNVRKLIRGRDAILTGTVDVAQLNVTGAMSAEIVRAMDIQARRGIFTEGLTAQDATLLGTTVAETLNAGTVAARIMTSGMLQTTTTANRGVKINSTGINAWDDAGTQTMRLNGTSNYITGTFATAEKEQRVEIKSGGSTASADFYGSGQTVDHLGVWHQADQGDATASRIISQNGLKRIRENPGMIMWPFRGDFSFTGRWSRNTDTVKMFSLVNYSGIPGGAWVDLTFTYPVPFPTTYSELIPVMSVESRSGAECTINTRTNNADSISFRVVNKSTNPTNELYVRGFTFNFNTVTYSTTY